jgi:uncharacterized membrane protein
MGSLVAFLTSDGGLRGGAGPADAAQSAERKFKMAHLEESIEVAVPVRTAYNQWTQFEEFPKFMEGVKSVRQISDNLLTWRAEIGGKEVEWNALITQQEPDARIGWRSTAGAHNAGSVSFVPIGPSMTMVTLRLEYEPEGAVQNTGSALGLVTTRIKGDLKRFKKYIETRGVETGAWRGDIHGTQVHAPRSGNVSM